MCKDYFVLDEDQLIKDLTDPTTNPSNIWFEAVNCRLDSLSTLLEFMQCDIWVYTDPLKNEVVAHVLADCMYIIVQQLQAIMDCIEDIVLEWRDNQEQLNETHAPRDKQAL
jgi:hypothetical protein